MARVEIEPYDDSFTGFSPSKQIKVTLSRRNLLALLHKIDMEGSVRRLENNHVKIDGELVRHTVLVLCCEDDDEHYANEERGAAKNVAGAAHPDTEAFIRDWGSVTPSVRS